MKRQTTLKGLTLWLAIASAIWALNSFGAESLRYVSKPGGAKVVIEGTSTVHDWVTEGKIIGGSFEIEPSFRTDLTLKSVQSLQGKAPPPIVDVFIPVTSLKSTVLAGREKMDEVMREAMRAAENPRITYKLTAMSLKVPPPESGSPVKFNTKGQLQVAGITNIIDMDITMERLDGDRLKFTGSKMLKMTDFKITPPAPRLAMGLIKTDDSVTIRFEWIVGLQTGP